MILKIFFYIFLYNFYYLFIAKNDNNHNLRTHKNIKVFN